jgi:cyclopropane fatty-acyl-phospholipid synthase-like methyltransferase
MYLVRFGEHTLKKLVGWLENNKCVGKDFNVLDIGCGNGVTLVEMVRFNSTNLILDNSLIAEQFFLEFQSRSPLLF